MTRARIIGWLLLTAAFAVGAVGLFWYAGAGLPYQDPTPDLLERQAAELQVAQSLMLIGLGVSVVVAVWLWKSRQKPR